MFGDARRILAEFVSYLVLPAMVKSCAGAVVDELPLVRVSSHWPSEFDLELGRLQDESVADCLGNIVVKSEKEVCEFEVVKVSSQSLAVLEEL